MSKKTKVCLIAVYFCILAGFVFAVFNMSSASAAQPNYKNINHDNYYVSCTKQLYMNYGRF